MNFWVFFISVCMMFAIAKSMPGGWTEVKDLNSPNIQKTCKKAAALVSQSINSPNHLKLVNVTKVKQQVVSGMNYEIEMELGPTKCEKSENLTEQQIDDCSLQKCGEHQHCIVRMWVKSWENFNEITQSSCHPGEPSC